jgi:hypothetical protein
MPAASATAKVSFSVPRRLKTCVSSAMKNDRLSSRGLMHIHRDDRELDLQNLVWYKIGPLRGGSSGAKFLLEALVQSIDKSLCFVMAQLVCHLATSLLESSNDKSMSANKI